MGKVPARLRPAVLRELVYQEAELRFRAGEQPTRDEYLARFPDDAGTLEQIWNGIQDQHGGLTAPHSGKRMLPLPREFGRYRVERELGRGGMGAVFLARDTQLDRDVALKVLFFDLSQDGTARARFLHEARAMATLQHPNLCPIYDVGEFDGRQFLSMPCFSGKTLAARLRDEVPWEGREVAAFVAKLAAALQHAHAAGIVHRDLKPGNIMFDARGEPVIMDFGLARRTESGEESLTHTGSLVGSPAYMAPEQVEGKGDQIGPATDIWALGVIQYQMLCGHRPFEGGTGSVLSKIVSTEPPSLLERIPSADPNLVAICQKAMSKEPKNRFASAAAMGDALEAYLSGNAVASQFMRSASKRSKLRWVALAAVILIGSLGAIAMRNNGRQGTTTTAAEHDGWISLFPLNEGLTGWKVLDDGKWSLKEGVLSFEGSSPSRILNDRVFSDFELSMEYFMPAGGDSSVSLRAPSDGGESPTVQLTDDDNLPNYRSGTVMRLVASPLAVAPQRIGDWNTLVLRAIGGKLTSSINGTVITEVDLFNSRWRRNIAGKLPRKEGHIVLQGVAENSVKFRNLRVRAIKP